MDSLSFTYQNKQITAEMQIIDKHMFGTEFRLIGKRGSLFIFRNDDTGWSHAYGSLKQDLSDAIMTALILRFETDVIDTFIIEGSRKIVKAKWTQASDHWSILIDGYDVGYIARHKKTRLFHYHLLGTISWLTIKRMDHYKSLLANKVL